MEKRELVIERSPGYIRAAVLEEGRLCELHDEREEGSARTETLFYGRVQAVRPSLNAAFVEIGLELNAFLPLREGEVLRGGQWLIVQGAAQQSTQTKGLRVSRKIQLAGRFLVMVPGESGVHVSQKVRDPRRRQELYRMAQSVCPQGYALIVRTATEGVTAQTLEAEARELDERWKAAVRKSLGMIRPGVLMARETLDMRLVRDLAGQGLERIVTNSPDCIQAVHAAMQEGKIAPETRAEFFDEEKRAQRLFDALNLETQIERALRRRIWLPCGGYLVIDFCEAMTVIDVNSGKMTQGTDVEETALRVNLEAVYESARQIRLRDVGGIVIIDLIDMQEEASRDAVIAAMKEAAAQDRVPVSVEGLTRLGLLELTRRRGDAQLGRNLRTTCSCCHGLGEVLSSEEVARRAMRQAHRMVLSGQRGPFVIRCGAAAAQELEKMALPMEAEVYALAAPGYHREKFDIEQMGEEKSPPQGAKRLTPVTLRMRDDEENAGP